MSRGSNIQVLSSQHKEKQNDILKVYFTLFLEVLRGKQQPCSPLTNIPVLRIWCQTPAPSVTRGTISPLAAVKHLCTASISGLVHHSLHLILFMNCRRNSKFAVGLDSMFGQAPKLQTPDIRRFTTAYWENMNKRTSPEFWRLSCISAMKVLLQMLNTEVIFPVWNIEFFCMVTL